MAASIGKQPRSLGLLRRNYIKTALTFINSNINYDNTRSKHTDGIKRNSNVSSRTKGYTGQTGVNEVEEVEGNADGDFFGIPADFKLQQARFTNVEETCDASPQSCDSDHPFRPNHDKDLDLDGSTSRDEPRSKLRHKQRKKQAFQANFPTSFGAVSFDHTAYMRSKGNREALALKAREILQTFNKEISRSRSRKEIVSAPGSRSRSRVYKSAKSDDEQSQLNLFDEQYFGTISDKNKVQAVRSAPDSTLSLSSKFKDRDFGNFMFVLNERAKSSVEICDGGAAESTTDLTSGHCGAVANTSTNFFDEQYFGGELSSIPSPDSKRVCKKQNDSQLPPVSDFSYSVAKGELNEVDLQYFGETTSQLSSESESRTSPFIEEVARDILGAKTTVLPEHEQYKYNGDLAKQGAYLETLTHYDYENGINILDSNQTQGKSTNMALHNPSINVTSFADSNVISSDQNSHEGKSTLNDITTNEGFLKRQQQQEKSYATKINKTESDSGSAFSFAMNFRRSLQTNLTSYKEEDQHSFKIPKAYKNDNDNGEELVGKRCRFDSKGYRILDLQVPNFKRMTSADAVCMLKNRIIFNHDDFLAIDKPFGLPSYGQQEDYHSVCGLLPSLASRLPRNFHAQQLHIVQGLDRDVTGALILAKTPEVAHILKGMYSSNECSIQRFWAITKGVPKPPEGIVDIPIGEGRVAGIYRRMLRPLRRASPHPQVKLSKAPSEAAMTDYKVLSRSNTTALLECTPLTNGVKHQLRVHLAFGLNTPILGDHKYSHFSKLAPQKLDPSSLALLKIRQAKVRHLALHLHLRSVVLTNYKGRMIFLTTRPPTHFVDNLRSLKLQMPKK